MRYLLPKPNLIWWDSMTAWTRYLYPKLNLMRFLLPKLNLMRCLHPKLNLMRYLLPKPNPNEVPAP